MKWGGYWDGGGLDTCIMHGARREGNMLSRWYVGQSLKRREGEDREDEEDRRDRVGSSRLGE